MKIEVPDEFAEFLKGCDLSVRMTIELLQWASDNPEETRQFLEDISKLNAIGKQKLDMFIKIMSPCEALAKSLEYQKQKHNMSSLFHRAIWLARKGGYKFRTEKGVDGIFHIDLVPRENYTEKRHVFTFSVQGVKVDVVVEKISMEWFYHITKTGDIVLPVERVLVDGKPCTNVDSRARVLEAIEKNVNPYAFLLIE
jgi:hypothetical protein